MPGKARDRAAVMADWVPASADPPPGSVGNDRDGAYFYMGCKPWDAASEGQEPGQPPPPIDASRQEPDRCSVCGTDVPAGMVCAGCLRDPTRDGRLVAEVVRDRGKELERQAREAAEKGPQDFAARMHKVAAKQARQSDSARLPAPTGPAEPRPQPGRKRAKAKR